MAVDLLEYMIRVAGGAVASAEIKGLRDDFVELGDAAKKAGAESDVGGARLSKGLSAVGKVGLGLGTILAATGIKATEMSNTFQTEMLKIRTEGGATGKEFTRMRAGVLDLAASGQSMGQGPTSLAQGLYHLESMGLRGRKAILGLKLASQEAAISGASLEDTTTSLGAAMFINAKGTGSMSHAMGSLIAIAGAGNMRFQDLNGALGTGFLGAAKTAGISIQDAGAALAVLTDSGYKASSAAAQLGTALHYLYAPTTKGAAALASIGIKQNQLACDLRKPNGLMRALSDLHDHMAGMGELQQANVLNELLPGGRGRVLLNLYQLQHRLTPKTAQIFDTQDHFSQHVAEQQRNPTTKLAEANVKLQASMVRLGDTTSRVLTPILAKGMDVLSALVDVFGKAPGPILTFVGVIVAGTAAFKLFNLVTAENPIGIVILAVAALAAGLVYAYEKVRWFHDAVDAVFGFIKDHWPLLLGILTGPIGLAVIFIIKHFTQIVTFVKGLPGKITTAAKGMWDGMKAGLRDVVNFIIRQVNHAIDAINSADSITIFGHHIGAPRIHHLGYITTGHNAPARVSTRSQTPLHYAPHGAHANVEHVEEHIHVHMDGREIGHAMRKYQRAAMMGGVA